MMEGKYSFMVEEVYTEFAVTIEKMAENIINTQREYSWRELKSLRSKIVYEGISCLILFIRKKNGYSWKNINYSVLSKSDVERLLLSFSKIPPLNDKLNKFSISTVYQMLLADDLRLEDGKYHFVVDKHERDNLGAYYTPNWLADQLIDSTIKTYFKTKINEKNPKRVNLTISDFQKIRVADLSAGGGAFLTAYLRWIKKNLSPDERELKEIVHNMYGVDVDPTSLLICEHEISCEINGELGVTNLILGNPLLPLSSSDENLKRKLFSEGRIYNQSSGISYDFKNNKFDMIFGNPPWEKIRLEDRKFFKQRYPEISRISQKNLRNDAINALKSLNSKDYNFYQDVYSDYSEVKKLLKSSSLLRLSLSGELNTYNLFYELALNVMSSSGVVGLLVKSSMVKTPANKKLFNYLVSNNMILEIDLIKNNKKIFSIDSREEFAFVISSLFHSKNIKVFPNMNEKKDFLSKKEGVEIDSRILEKLNPSSGMLPNISSASQMKFLVKMHRENSLFSEVFSNVKFGRLVHFTNHSDKIYKSKEKGIPVYEGKFIERYNSRFSTFEGMKDEEKYKAKASATVQTEILPAIPQSRYFIDYDFWKILSKNYDDKLTVMWRSLTSSTNRRTMLATILPFMPTSQSIQFLQTKTIEESVIILALFNSVVFDFLVRLKIPGIDLTQSVVKSIPVPHYDKFKEEIKFNGKVATYFDHISARVKWLYRDETRLFKYLEDFETAIFSSNKECEMELDKLIGLAYGLSKEELKRIASQFPAYYSSKELELIF